MTRVLGLSILFLSILTISIVLDGASPVATSKPKTPTVRTPASTSSKPLTANSAFEFGFLEQAEDIEREAWWVLTNQRREGVSSPFRILRAALLKTSTKSQTRIRFKFCQKLRVDSSQVGLWRVESECSRPSQEIGRIQKLSVDRWRVEWRTGMLPEHFGLGTSILFTKQSCEIQLSSSKRIRRMTCPGYARNRSEEEIVELKIFDFDPAQKSLLKLSGNVKKNLQVLSTIKTEVPLAGDVIVKEKVVNQKLIGEPGVETTDFSNSPAAPKNQKPVPQNQKLDQNANSKQPYEGKTTDTKSDVAEPTEERGGNAHGSEEIHKGLSQEELEAAQERRSLEFEKSQNAGTSEEGVQNGADENAQGLENYRHDVNTSGPGPSQPPNSHEEVPPIQDRPDDETGPNVPTAPSPTR